MSSCAVPGQKRRLFKDAGRVCPVDYHIPADAFAGAPQRSCEVLYVVGGLYGNLFALNAVKSMVAEETADTLVVFNGDMHWFDKTAENFDALEQTVATAGERFVPLVGNVEAELRRKSETIVPTPHHSNACTAKAMTASAKPSQDPGTCAPTGSSQRFSTQHESPIPPTYSMHSDHAANTLPKTHHRARIGVANIRRSMPTSRSCVNPREAATAARNGKPTDVAKPHSAGNVSAVPSARYRKTTNSPPAPANARNSGASPCTERIN